MRNVYQSKLFILSFYFTTFLFVFSCSPIQIKKTTVQKDGYYKFTAQYAGLKIFVDPYTEKKRLQDFFGCDLISRKVLPVLVGIENISAEDGYVLLKDKSRLVTKSSKLTNIDEIEGVQSSKLQEAIKDQRRATMIMGGLGIISPITMIITLPALGAAEKRVKDEYAIKRNIEEKQLIEKPVYPGEFQSGFLYFLLNSEEDINMIAGFSFIMQNLRTKEVVSIIISAE